MSLNFIKFILLVFYLKTELCTPLKILGVFATSSHSHFLMIGRLMKKLAEHGHQVDVISMFPQNKPIDNYQDIVIRDPNIKILSNNFTYNRTKSLATLSLKHYSLFAGYDMCKRIEHPAVQNVLKSDKGAYDVILVEVFMAPCYIAIGKYLHAPVVGIVTSKVHEWTVRSLSSPLNPSYIPSVFSSFSQRMTFWERLQNTFLTKFNVIQMNYYMKDQLDQVERYFGRKLKSVDELYNDLSLVLVNSHHSINEVRPLNPDVIEVGGLHIVDDGRKLEPDLQEWLDGSSHGCILFTFGSMIIIESSPPEMLSIFYEMFERIAPVRVIWKIADPTKLPPGLPKNVKTAPWLPQLAVFKHKNMKIFITHGGLMSTQEAIVYKIPMIGLPMFSDQHSNINDYVNKKIAIALSLEDLTADKLTNAVEAILNDSTYKTNIEKISKLFLDRPMSAVDTAVYWVEYTARHPKVLKSPATELTWWQFYLLDVYCCFLLCLLVVILFLRQMGKYLWITVCRSTGTKILSELRKNQ